MKMLGNSLGRSSKRSHAGDTRHKLYTGSKWRRLRAQHLQRFPLCQHCLEQGLIEPASVVDHRLGHGIGWESRFYDPAALQSLCAPCHSIKTAAETPGGVRRVQSTDAKQPRGHLHVSARPTGRRSTP